MNKCRLSASLINLTMLGGLTENLKWIDKNKNNNVQMFLYIGQHLTLYTIYGIVKISKAFGNGEA